MQAISDFTCDSNDGRANITINTTIYSVEAIHAAIYQFMDRYNALISPSKDEKLVTIIFEAKYKSKDINKDLKEFANAVIDHQIRFQLEKSNGKIRELIVAHAFSPIDLMRATKSV